MVMINDVYNIQSIYAKETCIKEIWTNDMKDASLKKSIIS